MALHDIGSQNQSDVHNRRLSCTCIDLCRSFCSYILLALYKLVQLLVILSNKVPSHPQFTAIPNHFGEGSSGDLVPAVSSMVSSSFNVLGKSRFSRWGIIYCSLFLREELFSGLIYTLLTTRTILY